MNKKVPLLLSLLLIIVYSGCALDEQRSNRPDAG